MKRIDLVHSAKADRRAPSQARTPCTTMVRTRVWTSALYRKLFGWTTDVVNDQTMLALGCGIVAVTVPAAAGPAVVTHLRTHEVLGPTLALSGSGARWMFLADPNGFVAGRLPNDADVLDCPMKIQLPDAETTFAKLRWVVPPDPVRRWLPTATAVLSVIDDCRRFGMSPDIARSSNRIWRG